MRSLLFVLLGFVAGLCLAVEIDYKGTPFGVSKQEFLTKYPEFASNCEKIVGREQTCTVRREYGSGNKVPSYADQWPVSISVYFLDGNFEAVLVFFKLGPYSSDVMPNVIKAMIAKYGQPRVKKTNLQNKLGAVWTRQEMYWTFDNSEAYLIDYYMDDTAYVTLESKKYVQVTRRQSGPSKDLWEPLKITRNPATKPPSGCLKGTTIRKDEHHDAARRIL